MAVFYATFVVLSIRAVVNSHQPTAIGHQLSTPGTLLPAIEASRGLS